jgi:RNA polymerase sigma-70 factor (ECF subfamily)
VDLYPFDDEFVRRLCTGDREAELFFFRYFWELLFSKLRRRVSALDAIEDMIQDTFVRVLRALCPAGLRDNRTLGSYVNSTAGHVLQERYRKTGKREAPLEDYPNLADRHESAEKRLMRIQDKLRVHRALDALDPPRDAEILRAIFIDERDKDEVCREFGIDRNYLRVVLFRAKENFRSAY